jgi:ammonium transporter, Amt family
MKIDTNDLTWIMISTALVMLMTPGLALFYGGMVRRKNVLGTIMQSFIALGVITLQWVLWGYSISFGPDCGHVIGNLSWAGLNGVGLEPNPDYAATIPHQAFMIYQMMFAIITPALITGAVAERFKFKTYIVFLLLWSTLVYAPIAHWVWGAGGWLRSMGTLDFAGGFVVHISSGVSALAAAFVLGHRKNYGHDLLPPHNLTMTLTGAALLWFGWFGFNAGSALTSGTLALTAFINTQFAAASATLSWMCIEWYKRGKPTVLGAASGAIAGLAGITPASGFVTPPAAIVIGLCLGVVCYWGVSLKKYINLDDSLDVVGVHGVGSAFGALAIGLFATTAVNAAGKNGLFYGNSSLLGIQAISVAVVAVFSFVMTWLILKFLQKTMGLRVQGQEEEEGLDLSQHGESGYMF